MNFSKRLLITLVILVILLLLAFFIFDSKFVVKAQSQIKIFPTSYNLESSGDITWENPQNAFTQDLSDNASFSNFNEENSASIKDSIEQQIPTTTVTTVPEETTTTTVLESTTTTTAEQPTTTTIESTTTTTIKPTTSTTILPPEETTTTTILQETTTSTEPISFLKKFFEFLIPKVNAEEENQIANSFAAIIFDDFSLPEDFDLNEIQNIQLRFSLAGKGEEGDELKISYFYDNKWQNFGELDLYSEISNNTNGGYFLYALPIFENPEDLQNLKIKFQILGSESQEVYLDSVWLEIDYEEIIQEVVMTKKTRHDWKIDEEPEFNLPEVDNTFLSRLKSLMIKEDIDVSLFTPDGKETKDGIIIQGNIIKITKFGKFSFKPGLYKLKIKKGKEEIIQEFTWGVLAINTNKSIYLPGEKSYIQMQL